MWLTIPVVSFLGTIPDMLASICHLHRPTDSQKKKKRFLELMNFSIHFFFCVCVDYDDYGRDEFSFGNRQGANGGNNNNDHEGPTLSKLGSSSTAELHPKAAAEAKPSAMPPASVMTRLILIMVWRKLIRNPNTYSSLFGLTWSLVSFR